MAATNNNLLDSIFYFFTKPLIVYKIFYFLWSNDTLGKTPFLLTLRWITSKTYFIKLETTSHFLRRNILLLETRLQKIPTLDFSLLFNKVWMKAIFGTMTCGVTILYTTKESF